MAKSISCEKTTNMSKSAPEFIKIRLPVWQRTDANHRDSHTSGGMTGIQSAHDRSGSYHLIYV